MVITEKKLIKRTNTSIPFFGRSNDPVSLSIRDSIAPYLLNETLTWEAEQSDDGLTQTLTQTYANLQVYSEVSTIYSIDLDYAFKSYVEGPGFVPPVGRQYTQLGIEVPFTRTTTYNYNPESITSLFPGWEQFIRVLENSNKLISFTNTGSALIAIHQYNNSADYTDNRWLDYRFVEGLHAGHVTRTITHALV